MGKGAFMKSVLPALILLLLSTPASARDWRWQLPAARYQKLNTFERALYDKGRSAFEAGEYRAAATAFEKLKVEHAESKLLSYAILMQGMSLHQAKDRGKAIRAYSEVLDYFGDVIEDSAPALYFLGVAHFDNGDKKAGILAMKEMVEDEDYSKHPLAAGALTRLADNYWANQEKELAVKYWKQVVADFSESNSEQADEARNSVYIYYSEENRVSEIAAWLLTDVHSTGVELAKKRADIANDVVKVLIGSIRGGKYNQAKYKKSREEQAAALWGYLAGEKEAFRESDRMWKFYTSALHLTGAYLNDDKTVDQLLTEATAYIKEMKDVKDRDHHINSLADFLQDNVDIGRAINLIESHSNPNYAAYKKADYLSRWGKVTEAAKQYEACEKMPDQNLAKRALEQRANLYRERLNKQDEAIKLYQELSNPPSNLWNIADCHLRKKDYKMALSTWQEIENSFPNEGARAAWSRAEAYQQMGENKLAVAEARGVLKRYPKSRESSSAHQLLEAYGINTGGGVEN